MNFAIFSDEHKGLEPKNPDFPGPGAYGITRPWEPIDYHKKKVPFNTTSSRNDKRSFTYSNSQNVCSQSEDFSFSLIDHFHL